ncbi:hypothetical protein C882_0561 [Caenispirillum salinarum AK4]|uniref:Uncharacterized protein n=1 Tax=Caenispirillum salinarum AK4 TaxID=1238182 RepID=K9GWX7_9PROT|nr:hypothetical protein C882_0561 [Caenispirillum salinarum AK4]
MHARPTPRNFNAFPKTTMGARNPCVKRHGRTSSTGAAT